MLIANKISNAHQVVTIAANLDVDAWTALHQYTPLARSLNGKNFPRLDPSIRQVHLVGELDENVPTRITRPVAEKQGNSKVEVVPGYEHQCCWPKDWASRLASYLSKTD